MDAIWIMCMREKREENERESDHFEPLSPTLLKKKICVNRP